MRTTPVSRSSEPSRLRIHPWAGPARAIALLSIAVTGCATTLPTFQPADTLAEGQVRVVAGVSGTPPVGTAGDALDDVERLDLGGNPSEAQVRDAAASAALLQLRPPAVDAQAQVSYGALDWLELGARITSTSVGGQVRLRLFDEAGFAGSIGFLGAGGFAGVRADRFFDEVSLEGYRGFDLGVPLLFGYEGRRGRVWAGPRFQLTRAAFSSRICADCATTVDADVRGTSTFWGGQLGFAIGGDVVSFVAELVVGRSRVRGDVTASTQGVTERVAIDERGLVVEPGIGLLVDM